MSTACMGAILDMPSKAEHPILRMHVQLPEDDPAYCISAVMGGGTLQYLVLGNSFMRSYYAVFSVGAALNGSRVGLAPST